MKNSRINTERVPGDEDQFEDHAVTFEQPPRIAYADHQPGLDPEQLAGVEFPKNRPIQESWTDARKKLAAILKRTKGYRE